MPTNFSDLAGELDRAASSVPLHKGAALFQCGDRVSGVFIVRKGEVTLSLDAPNAVFPAVVIGPGGIVGLPAALTGTYSLSAHATEDSELGFIPSNKVTEILECSPSLSLVAMRIMSEEIARIRSALRSVSRLEASD